MTDHRTLTTRQGHPVRDDQSTRAVGESGPPTLESYQLIENITRFNRERIPERVMHARGAGARGCCETYGRTGTEPASKCTRAKVLNETDVRTPMLVRFSTVIGSEDSPETARGPVANRQETWRFHDFVQHRPEALHMVSWIKGPSGIPANHRPMQGSSLDTCKLVNGQGAARLAKFSWVPKQDVKSLTSPEAAGIQAKDVGHATKGLCEAIDRGDHPEWELCVQLMTDDPHDELDLDLPDDAQRWPEDKIPLLPVGRMALDQNPANVFGETEQVALDTGLLVDGVDLSDDKMLQGRTPSSSDTQRHRVGTNDLQLPVNAPKVGTRMNRRDGQMALHVNQDGENPHVNSGPSAMGGLREAPKPAQDHRPWVEGHLGRYQNSRTQGGCKQAGERCRTSDDRERDDLTANRTNDMKACPESIQLRMAWHFWHCDPDHVTRAAQGAGVDLARVKASPPPEGTPAPGERRAAAGTDGTTESKAHTNGAGSAQAAAE